MEMLGNLDRDCNAMFVEAIDQILAIWAGDAPYNLKGQFWNLSTERTLIREITGDFGTLLYAGHDWADPRLARRSMQLMAEQVMPAVNAAIRVG